MAELHPAQLLFTEKHPLTAEFDMTFHSGDDHSLEVRLDAPASFADQDGIHVHTGFHTLILDTVMGACAIGELKTPVPIATVKLTSNHLRNIKVGEQVVCRAEWEDEAHSIAYVRGEIRSAEGNLLASHAVATFMIGTAGKPLGKKK
ncbi:MAG: PaaI family thioesterase [Pseudomonadota bacterium]